MQSFHPATPDPAACLRRAFGALLVVARDLLGRIATVVAAPSARPGRPRATPELRTARTVEWLAALAATLAGDRTWLRPITYFCPRFPGRYPALTADLRRQIGLPPVPPKTSAQQAAGRRHYIRTVFATQSTARIAARLARRLGLSEASEAWPHALLAIAATPAAHAKTIGAKPRPAPKPQTPPSPLT